MKVLLYTEGLEGIKNSGLGKAIYHQIESLKGSDMEYTLDSNCTDYDIVHINFYNPKAYFFAKKAHKLGKKVVYHAHSTKEDFRKSFPFSNLIAPLFKKWIIKCYKQGDYIITPTDYSKKLLETYNLGRPIYPLSNGINIEFFEKNSRLGKQFREDFGFKPEDKVIMSVGLYFERKGILDFVELAKRMPEYKFIWFGYNPPYMSPMKIRKAIKTDLPNLYFPGYVEPEILRGAYSGADLFIFPTHEETEGIPILEAFASKINTIVSNIPVFDWVKDKKEVYKANDINEFEYLIKEIINKQLPSLVDNAYKIINDKDIKNVGKQLISIYKGVYMEQNKKLIVEQQNLNNKLANMFSENGIKKFRLLSLGNSIGSGYSMVRTIKPLLLRNQTLEEVMSNNDIDIDIHHFSRAQNNSDEHIFDWIQSNITQSKFNESVRNDYSGSTTSMPSPGLDKSKIDEYYPINQNEEEGLKDIILKSDENLANIVVYNGCTGSFLDNVTRGGKITHKLTYGVKRDIKGLEATLKYIQYNNRFNGSNTQIYICGAPNWLGIHLTDILNNKLKQIAKQYANTTYVDSVPAKIFYKKLNADKVTDPNEAQSILSKIPFPAVDMHYDETEYLKFNNNIIEAINDNFLVKKQLIGLDRELYKLNAFIEKSGKAEFRTSEYLSSALAQIINKQCKLCNTNLEKEEFQKMAYNYLMHRLPYDFYYLGKKNIKEVINDEEKKIY